MQSDWLVTTRDGKIIMIILTLLVEVSLSVTGGLCTTGNGLWIIDSLIVNKYLLLSSNES